MADSSPPDSPDSPLQRGQKRPFTGREKPFSAGAGCMIPIIMLVLAVVFVSFTVFTAIRQNRLIGEFAQPTPVAIEAAAVADGEAAALRGRLASFAEAAAADTASLSLTARDLNVLIASEPELAPVRDIMAIESIAPDGIAAAVSFPMNTLGSSENRFLNGTVTFVPIVSPDTGLTLSVADITVPNRTVSEGFVAAYRGGNYLDALLLDPFRSDHPAAPTIRSIRAIQLADGSLTAHAANAAAMPPRRPDYGPLFRLFFLGALAILALAAVGIIIRKRRGAADIEGDE